MGCSEFALAVAMRKWWLISRQICGFRLIFRRICGFLVDLSLDLWWLVEDVMCFCEIYVVGFVGFVMVVGGCGGLMNLWWLVEDIVGLW